MKYYMTEQEFDQFLLEIGGLEHGYRTDRGAILSSTWFEVDCGWLGLVKELIEELIKAGWNRQICQVKEKFGGLRFYINDAPEEVWQLIDKYERLSQGVCEKCGEPGSLNRTGWWKTLCENHQ
jgi:hypothetical protein